ncbi:50S ribosomal protein L11 methyltransferase [Zavarzinia compransoris]|uniref:Ribosomal protein L11 methyltransferase n=1 Tax=Zavarzinia compransoris TaxID=1264899 RepID=A0A317E188_9PROT|nr:50S ribosomal protein L11 methyltransferase [Zavarzinia compransoris]PWR19886.1 50S ribosomal protein L11 methyltransferase [Zavarzinia compransoris]TDP45001.1 [LSU ribosomal protein L11P]-lysine N-methyltransferase [Zavarzinia compransoris]
MNPGAGLIEAHLTLPPEAVPTFELMLSDLVVALTSMTYDDGATWTLEALLGPDGDREALADALVQAAEIAGIDLPPIEWRVLPDVDWVSETQKILSPLSIGRFWIHGPEAPETPPTAALTLEIEAGLAFGTGRHATTAGCVLALERLAKRRRFRRVIDVGAGSGILAMAARLLWVPPVLFSTDVDPVAVLTARENMRRNGLWNAARHRVADGVIEREVQAAAPFDLIIANILAVPLTKLARQICDVLAPGGVIILSGLLVSQEQLVLAAYRARGLHLADRIRRDGWATLVLAR